MKPLVFLFMLTTIITNLSFAQKKYDSVLAARVGADDYGMKQYVMVFLKAGPNRTKDSVKREQLQAAHLKNISRLASEGKLIVAGPFLDNGDIRGIFILNVKTLKEAEELVNSDPAVQAGSLIMELHPWYGSAALVETARLHKSIQKINPFD